MMKTACLQKLSERVFASIIILLFYTLAGIFFSGEILAAEETNIVTSVSSEIVVDSSNIARFSIQITFENIGENPTALSIYDLRIGSVYPIDVTALSGSSVLVSSVKENSGSVIQIMLGNTMLRPGLTYTATVSYTVENYLVLYGGAFDVELPLFHQSDRSRRESVTFSYPEAFGKINYATADFVRRSDRKFEIATFNDLLDVDRLFLSVGNQKYISMSMERSFSNDSDGYVKQDVLIPPEFSSQQFIITSISPSPDRARSTDDGNILLTYSVPGDDTLWVRISGILVQTMPTDSIRTLTNEERATYLDTQIEWWNIDNDTVLSDIKEISRLDSLDEKIENIYNYTQKELILSEGFRQLHGSEFRKGASVALKTYKNASVEDYADVFVALARYAEIPARIVAGYVYPYSIDKSQLGMFHVWPQYWSDEYGWVSVDPAYEMYTGLPCRSYVGLSRVVVASSYDEELYGSFQETSSEFILTDEMIPSGSELSAELEIKSHMNAGSYAHGILVLRNTGNRILTELRYDQSAADDVRVELGDVLYNELIVPGQKVSVPFTIEPFEWYESGSRPLSFSVSATAPDMTVAVDVSRSFTVDPLWWVKPVTWIITIMAFAVFMWSLWSGATLGGWLFRLFRRNRPDKIDDTIHT